MPALDPPQLAMWIGGEWRGALNGGTFDDHNPWDATVVATVPAGDAEDALDAVAAATTAFPAWAATTPGARQAIFLRAAANLEQRAEEVRHLLAIETGCGPHFAGVQVAFAADLLRQAAQVPYRATGSILPSDREGTVAVAHRRPVGVVAAIPPWNAAVTLSTRAVAVPLAAGNCVVLKPSEESPWSGGILLADIFTSAGLPPGVLNVVTHAPGEAGSIAEALTASPHVRKVNFTGSTATGRRLAEIAGRHLTPLLLQLSGHNPLIVLADCDVPAAARAAAYGSFVHQGQVCMCSRRIFVETAVADRFTAAFVAEAQHMVVGDPQHPDTLVGPLINEWALRLVERRVDEAIRGGATLLTGGTATGPCYPPTVLTGVPTDCELNQEETFGPVAILETVDNAEHALARANDSEWALSAGVMTRDEGRGARLAARLTAGMVHVNDQPVNDEAHMPFGGSLSSGWGRFGAGPDGDDFTEVQLITTRHAPRDPFTTPLGR